MSLTHVHLLLNHFPIIGTIIGLCLFLAALVAKSDHLKQASLIVFTGIALLSIPTYMSGNAAAKAIENMPGVSKSFLEAHNSAALVSLIFVEITGIFAWLGLWQYRRFSHAAVWNLSTVLLLSVVAVYFMSITGNTGGEIRHPEIRAGQEIASAEKAAEQIPRVAWLNAASVASFVTETSWMWPTCETLHFIGLSLLMGVVFLIDLRMLGVMKNVSFPALHRLLPWGILGFGLNVLTGLLFFIGTPDQYETSAVFQWKIIFVMIAGANALYFTMVDETWVLAPGDDAPLTAKVVAVSAMFLWAGVMWCGNMLPFIGNSF
jgi:uncharacterized membrane protein